MNLSEIEIEIIAAACHHVNRAWCLARGDESQPLWEDAPTRQRDSAIAGVTIATKDPSPVRGHEQWVAEKLAAGWVYGAVKNPNKKTHPCLVPYDDLPAEQKAKDTLFVETVTQLAKIFNESERAALRFI